MSRSLPEGYSVRTVVDVSGEWTVLAPFWRGQQIAEGRDPFIWGYRSTIRKMRRICRLHAKNRIDR